jgi:hypothetical protein
VRHDRRDQVQDPVGFDPERTTFTDYAAGTCTGTLNGVFMENERAYLRPLAAASLAAARTESPLAA